MPDITCFNQLCNYLDTPVFYVIVFNYFFLSRTIVFFNVCLYILPDPGVSRTAAEASRVVLIRLVIEAKISATESLVINCLIYLLENIHY